MERQAPHAYPCTSPLQIIEPTSVARSTITKTSGEVNSSGHPRHATDWRCPLLRACGQAPNLEKRGGQQVTRYSCGFEVA